MLMIHCKATCKRVVTTEYYIHLFKVVLNILFTTFICLAVPRRPQDQVCISQQRIRAPGVSLLRVWLTSSPLVPTDGLYFSGHQFISFPTCVIVTFLRALVLAFLFTWESLQVLNLQIPAHTSLLESIVASSAVHSLCFSTMTISYLHVCTWACNCNYLLHVHYS